MAEHTLTEYTQRWVAKPTDSGSFALLEQVRDDDADEALAHWHARGHETARLATVRLTTTIEPDDA